MQQIERRKAYKACDPYTTINRVRAILASCGLFTIEDHRFHARPGVNCCRVMLGDDDLASLKIGTNGKGLTTRYALASAYGEFVERLQNGFLFPLLPLQFATRRFLDSAPSLGGFKARLEREGLVLDFHYAPDEVYLEAGALVDGCTDVLAKLLRIDDANKQKEFLYALFGEEPVACLPYYSVLHRRVRLLPIMLVLCACGSNGMCGGNTPEEALVQGISEVLERFVVRSIFMQGITPATVPMEQFQGTEVFDRIRRLEDATDFTATVKDCSLGCGLPVVGLLLIDRIANRYTFHVGADPCPITALERCLTEIFQGLPQDVKAKFHPMPGSHITRRSGKDSETARRTAFYGTILAGTGRWADSVLSTAETYPFKGFAHPISVSDADDLAYLVDLVAEMGHDLLIRDVSALGFPAYQVYIPGLSEIDFIFEQAELEDWMGILRNHRTLLNLKQASTQEIANLAKAIAKATALTAPSARPIPWFLINTHPALQQLSTIFLLTLLFSRIEDYRAAARYMNLFLQNRAGGNAGPPHSYWGIHSHLTAATDQQPEPQTKPALDADDDDDVPARVIEDFAEMLYYWGVRDYLTAKAEGLPESQIKAALSEAFGDAAAARVIRDFAMPEQLFDHSPWPVCFDCAACPIESSCQYLNMLRRVKTVQNLQRPRLPDQRAVANLFSSQQPSGDQPSAEFR